MEPFRLTVPTHLHIVCHKCTREARIPCESKDSGDRIGYSLGWRSDQRGFVCPRCPGGSRKDNLSLQQALNLEASVQQAITEYNAEPISVYDHCAVLI